MISRTPVKHGSQFIHLSISDELGERQGDRSTPVDQRYYIGIREEDGSDMQQVIDLLFCFLLLF